MSRERETNEIRFFSPEETASLSEDRFRGIDPGSKDYWSKTIEHVNGRVESGTLTREEADRYIKSANEFMKKADTEILMPGDEGKTLYDKKHPISSETNEPIFGYGGSLQDDEDNGILKPGIEEISPGQYQYNPPQEAPKSESNTSTDLDWLNENPLRPDTGENIQPSHQRRSADNPQANSNSPRPHVDQQQARNRDVSRESRTQREYWKGQRRNSTFIFTEKDNNSYLDKITGSTSEGQIPEFWDRMTDEEKKLYNVRVELNNLCFKARNVGTLEDYGRLDELSGLGKTELQLLYDRLDGHRQGLEYWKKLFDDPTWITVTREYRRGDTNVSEEINIFQAKDESEAERFRLEIQKKIRESISDSVRPDAERKVREEMELGGKTYSDSEFSLRIEELIDQKAQVAEQTSFNVLYGLRAFEDWSVKWSDNGRLERKMNFFNTRFVNPALLQEMHPLLTLISKSQKKPPETYGGLSSWFGEQLSKINDSDYDEIQIISESEMESQEKKLFTVSNRVLYIPEAYPRKLIGSAFSTTKVKIDGDRKNDKQLGSYLSNKTEIPWDDPELSTISSTYGSLCKKANTLTKYIQGKQSIRATADDITWDYELRQALEKFRDLDTPERKRWILYSALRTESSRKLPHLAFDSSLDIADLTKMSFGTKGLKLLPDNILLWRWDNVSNNDRKKWQKDKEKQQEKDLHNGNEGNTGRFSFLRRRR